MGFSPVGGEVGRAGQERCGRLDSWGCSLRRHGQRRWLSLLNRHEQEQRPRRGSARQRTALEDSGEEGGDLEAGMRLGS